MAMNAEQINYIEEVIRACLRDKFLNYNPETSSNPFQYRLLGKDRLALHSFIHALITSFGTSVFEPVAVALATINFKSSERGIVSGKLISSEAHLVIQEIMDGLITGQKEPNKQKEIEKIREVCQKGEMRAVKPTRIDVSVVSHDDEIFFFDIKTVKPNVGNFKEFKRTLLE